MIGELFGKSWELWKRNVAWLILAGLVVGVIVGAIFALGMSIFVGSVFTAGTLGISDVSSGSATPSLNGGAVALGIIAYIITMLVVQVLGMVFYGGMFEMVIGAEREARDVRFGDLFSGFSKFGAYVVFALVWFGISLGLSVIGLIPVLGWIIGLVIATWLSVLWLYVLPLIADQQLSFGDAAGRSKEMVTGVGWWSTFGLIVVLYIVLGVIAIAIAFIAAAAYQGSETTGIALGVVLFIAFAVLAGPFAICYISAMYLGSSPVPAQTARFGVPAPPAPPAGMSYAAAGVYQPSAPPARPAGDDAWRAAADPLAGQPVQSLHTTGGQARGAACGASHRVARASGSSGATRTAGPRAARLTRRSALRPGRQWVECWQFDAPDL